MADENNPLRAALNGEFERDWMVAMVKVICTSMDSAQENRRPNTKELVALSDGVTLLQREWETMLGAEVVAAVVDRLPAGWRRFQREVKRFNEARESGKNLKAARKRFGWHAAMFSLWITLRFHRSIKRGIEDGTLLEQLKAIGVETKDAAPQFKRGGEKPQ